MKRFIHVLGCILCVHAVGLLLTTLLRFVLYVAANDFMSAESYGKTWLQLRAFINGVWFDNVIGCYILALPLLVLLVCAVTDCFPGKVLRAVLIWMQTLWSVVLLISTANVPYFLFFFKNINSSIWNWAEYVSTTLGMLLGEPSYLIPLITFIILVVVFIWITNAIYKRMAPCASRSEEGTGAVRWRRCVGGELISLMCIALCIFGIRGRIGYNPIKVSAAYYCEDAFLNQLGVSPTFNLLRTSLDLARPENKRLNLMDEKEVIGALEHNDWTIASGDSLFAGMDTDALGKNVVVIFMESMSANFLPSFGNTKNLTPFIDSLYSSSLHFSQCYSTGFHTNQGMFATLYSYPAILERNMMKGTNIPKYEGLPTILRQKGYRTMFFMSHESQYDNMQAFYLTNGYDEVYSQEDYPKEKVVNSFGVQDDFLYDFAYRTICKGTNGQRSDGETASSVQPFFATILSISNHPEYVIPEYFHPKSELIEDQIVEYADWSLQRFFAAASRESWYENTVFVLVGDHGKLMGDTDNEMPQSCNHVPLIMYVPGMTPYEYTGWTEQMDIAPTLLALMGINFSTPFGRNVFRYGRPYAYYCMDDVMGVRSTDRLLIYNPATGQEMKYVQAERSMRLAKETDSTFDEMRRYLFVNMQAADKLTREHE